MQRSNVLTYRNFRYFKAASLLLTVAAAIYSSIEFPGGRSHGGTWLGYTLGIVSTLIVFLLMWYGIAKRRLPMAPERRARWTSAGQAHVGGAQSFAQRKTDRRKVHAKESWRYGGTLQGWLSAHVYLGTSLVILSTLHAGFRFGWNIHTLSYALMLFVIGSGIYGTFAYLNYPRRLTQNLRDETLNTVLLKIAELDESARIHALTLPDEIGALVSAARSGTRLGGNFFQQLSSDQPDCPTELAVRQLKQFGGKFIAGDPPRKILDLYSVLLQKQKLVLQARHEIMLNARMQLWLYLHAPLSIALLAALLAHVVAVLYY